MAAVDGATLDVPEDAEPHRCPYCSFPFQREQHLTLHLGVAHEDELDDDEREHYEETYETESHDLFTLHVKLTIALTLLYFAITYTYMFIWA